MRFLDLELEDPVPDATKIWLLREALAQAGQIDNLFERFGQHLEGPEGQGRTLETQASMATRTTSAWTRRTS
jgi:hypothetical protein